MQFLKVIQINHSISNLFARASFWMNFSGLSDVRSSLPAQILSSGWKCIAKLVTAVKKFTFSRILGRLLRFYVFPVKLADCQMIFSRSRRPSTFCLLSPSKNTILLMHLEMHDNHLKARTYKCPVGCPQCWASSYRIRGIINFTPPHPTYCH